MSREILSKVPPLGGFELILDAADVIESMGMELAAAEVSLSLAHELEMQQADGFLCDGNR
jgi:hypothetical protein